jgi:hypothetical protein
VKSNPYPFWETTATKEEIEECARVSEWIEVDDIAYPDWVSNTLIFIYEKETKRLRIFKTKANTFHEKYMAVVENALETMTKVGE